MLINNNRGAGDAYLSTLYCLADDLIYTGDSLCAMHCYDVLRAFDMLSEEFGLQEADITLYCAGNMGVYGVLAGFLKEKASMRYGENLLRNVEKEVIGQDVFRYNDTLSLVLPGMLEYFDYDELMR